MIGKSLRVFCLSTLAVVLTNPVFPDDDLEKVIAVSTSGSVKALPDVALVLLEVRSTSPLAANALEENNSKRAVVVASLGELGLASEQIEFSANQFAPAGGGRYIPGGQRATGFDVYATLKIEIPLAGHSTEELADRIASVLDELSKAGASTLSRDISMYSLGGSSAVVFTLKDSSEQEIAAYEDAISRARPAAEQIAKKMGVAITGVQSIQSSLQSVPVRPYPTPGLLDYTHLSTSPDELTVKANVTVNFSFE
jgi:uncharacterized protein YggE